MYKRIFISESQHHLFILTLKILALRISRLTKRVPSLIFFVDELSSQDFSFTTSHFLFIRLLDFFRLKYTASLTFLFFHRNVLSFVMQLILLSSVKITELNFIVYECSLADAEHISNTSERETLQ